MKKQTKIKKRPGRKTQYDPHRHPALVKMLAESGKTDAEMAQLLGVNRETLHQWRTRHPELAEASRDGKKEADGNVVISLYKLCMGFTGPDGKYYPPNVSACIWWTKNRLPNEWRDVQRQEHTGANGGPIRTCSEMTDEELEAVIAHGKHGNRND